MRIFLNPLKMAFALVALGAIVIIGNGCMHFVTAPVFVAPPAAGEARPVAHLAPAPPVNVQVAPPTVVDTQLNAPISAPATILLPTPTPMAALPATAPAPAHQPAQPAARLSGLTHFWQTWNNCGPATLAMNLSYYGGAFDQATIGTILRTHEDDKNVMPEEMVAFAQSQGFHAQLRVNGNADLLRTLLSNGIPVLIETWLEETPNDGMGHYRLLVGYDDASQQWIAYDSYVRGPQVQPNGPYAGVYLPYAQTADWWKVFNNTYLLVYTEAQAPLIASILGDALDEDVMWRQSLAAAQAAVEQQPHDPFLWFNLGTNLVQMGDFAGAAAAYDQARAIGLPWRMLWYQFGPFEAYQAMGRPHDLLALAEATLANTPSIEEAHYYRGVALAALGQPEAARAAWQRALALNPKFAPAITALN